MQLSKFCALVSIVLSFNQLLAQPGSIDLSFNPTDTGFGIGEGANGSIQKVVLQQDGKILIGGGFTSYNGASRNRIARLNSDGSVDNGFNVGTGADNTIFSVALQQDGKILIGGNFTSYNGVARNRIARLNADGSLDVGFDPGNGANNSVRSIALQVDGKILIGGFFSSYNGVTITFAARLNSDGSLDGGFNPATINSTVYTISTQPDGKILIGGDFTFYSVTSRSRIARLNSDGSLDNTFDPGIGANTTVRTAIVQSDGKILIGGAFTSYGGVSSNYIARINSDGSPDNAFTTGTGANSWIYSIILQTDGKILIAGLFTSYNGVSIKRIARLNADGSLDSGFISGLNDLVITMAIESNGKIIVGGIFTSIDGVGQNSIARLSNDGSLGAGFNHISGSGANGLVYTVAQQSDGKILIGGFFTSYNGVKRNYIARINSDGSLDATFDPGVGANNSIFSIALQGDGKIIIGGDFTSYNGVNRNRIARLNSNGSLDLTFDPGTGADNGNLSTSNGVYSIAVQSDGKILVGGLFTVFNGAPRNRIVRLNDNGSIDPGFSIGSGFVSSIAGTGGVLSLVIQQDGKILVGGFFITYNGTPRNAIARLNTDGSLDIGFNPGSGANNSIFSVQLQQDSKILIGGNFSVYNGVNQNTIARINPDGSLDSGFNPGTSTGTNSSIRSLALQSDGKILIGGFFTSYNGTAVNNLARLNINGSIDLEFNMGTGASSFIYPVVVLADKKILIGGGFTSFNGIGRNHICRIYGAPLLAPINLVATDISSSSFSANWGSVSEATSYRLDVSADNFNTFVPGFNDKSVVSTNSTVDGLSPNTTYKYRVRSMNSGGVSVNSNVIDVTTVKSNQVISFTPIPTKTIGDAPFNLSATSNSGLQVSYASSDLTKASIAGNTVTLLKAGLITITASQAGNSSFNSAASVSQTFCINPSKPAINISSQNSGTVLLTSSSLTGNQWFLNGTLLSGATANTFTADKEGSYTVRVTADNCSSENSDAKAIVITGDNNSSMTTGLHLYPLPTDKEITIRLYGFEKDKIVGITIYNL
ncbi:MAG: fibronectin type III domain-containing protein, partial [Cyclobacteriaceae bacterium]|nr:fibronectin type III domain-containing protein [Cyclobacteriaceae bacterium]